jgi:phosphoheptose isomerase
VTAASPAPGGPEIAPDILDRDLAADLTATALAMARRFAAGATMWCVAPGREPRARHLAAKFTHQITVGERALPAFALTGPDLLRQARAAVRSGDLLVAVAVAGDAEVADLMRRAPAWGAHTVWIGSGRRPPGGAADHVLWIDEPGSLTPDSGRFELLCHQLSKLTRTCFEHPSITAAAPVRCTAEVCVTCSDEGRLGEVIEPPAGLFDPAGLDNRAIVRTADGEEAVDVTLVAPVVPGDLVLVHAGTAITRWS